VAPDLATMKTVTVGCANFAPVAGDKAATLEKMVATIREAAAQGVEILAFPEEALIGAEACTGCVDGQGPCDVHVSLAETVPGPSTDVVARLAAEHDMYVIFGLAERDREDRRRLYNAAAIVGPDGVLGSYRKIHLGSPPWVTEGVTFAPGAALPVWPTRFGPIGVLICYDFWLNPELSRILALKGARLIVNCSASFRGPGKRDYFVHTTEVRAVENLVYTASANLVGGPDEADNYGATRLDAPRHASFSGCSTIAGPAFPRFNHIYAEAGETEELISATLSFTKLERWRAVYPWRDWRHGHQRHVSELVAKEFTELT
jgi:predicted amidohydrolase